MDDSPGPPIKLPPKKQVKGKAAFPSVNFSTQEQVNTELAKFFRIARKSALK